MKIDRKHILKAAVAVLVLGGLALCYVLFTKYYDRKIPNIFGEAELFIRPGTPWNEVGDSVAARSRVRWKASLERAFEEEAARGAFPKAGHYRVKEGMSSASIARTISHGWQEPVNLVLSGSLRKKGVIAAKIAAQMLADSAAVMSALCDTTLLESLGYRPDNVFSLFIPDTYQVYWTDSPEEILRRQKKASDAFWTQENLEKARRQGLSREEVGVLASIVNGETNYEPEMPMIAGVYLNRLRKGMKLQADPTVAFCFDYSLNRILKAHLKIDSPYNTYLNHGLPPGPICVPTKACLEAVLNPDNHGYLYFCASPEMDGTHRFAKGFIEHKKNARAFQKALDLKLKSAS